MTGSQEVVGSIPIFSTSIYRSLLKITICIKMNGVLIYFYLLAIIISLIVAFVLLVKKKSKLLGSIILVISLSLIAALIIDMITF